MFLEQIEQANDIKNIKKEDLPKLAEEIREFLINKISVTGGHLGSNLGAVELTMALHLVLDFPQDKIVWDVGHQSYVHKILTGRKNELKNKGTANSSFEGGAFKIYYSSMGCICLPSSAKATVSFTSEKSATSEKGLFTLSSWRKGTK